MSSVFTTLWICMTIVLSLCCICDTIDRCVKAKYDYWKAYDKGITDNLNKQLKYNNLKR